MRASPCVSICMRRVARQSSFRFVNWGGKRKGAGRNPKGEKARVRHESRARITKHEPALVTLRVCAGMPSLRDDAVFALVKSVRAKSAREDFRIVHVSLQSNHLHLVVEAHDNAALTRGMRSVPVRLAQGLNREFRRTGKVFVGRYHLHVLRTPKEVQQRPRLRAQQRAQAPLVGREAPGRLLHG